MKRLTLFSALVVFSLLASSFLPPIDASPNSITNQPAILSLIDFIPPAFTSVAVENDFAYVTAGHIFLVFDISNPDHPSRAAFRLLSSRITKVLTSSNKAFLLANEDDSITTDNYILIFDITTPDQPVLVNEHYQESSGVIDMAVDGTHLYLYKPTGISLLDVSNPQQPLLLSSLPFEHSPAVGVIGVAEPWTLFSFSASSSTLFMADFSNPVEPAITGKLQVSGYIRDIALSGNLAAVARCVDRLTYFTVGIVDLFDLTNPAQLEKMSSVEIGDGVFPIVKVWNERLYAAQRNMPLSVYDIHDPGSPLLLEQWQAPVWDLTVFGSRLAQAAGSEGLLLYDYHEAGGLERQGHFLATGNPQDVRGMDGLMFIADEGTPGVYASPFANKLYGGLVIGGLDETGTMQVLGKYSGDWPGTISAKTITVHEEQVYLVGYNQFGFKGPIPSTKNLYIVDITQPIAPSLSSVFSFGETYDSGESKHSAAAVRNGYAYVSTNGSSYTNVENGLAILDITQPQSPGLVTVYPQTVDSVAISNTYGLITTENYVNGVFSDSLQVIDVTDPLSITERTNLPLASPSQVILENNLGFILEQAGRLIIFDPSSLPAIEPISTLIFPFPLHDIAYDGRFAYLANGQAGIRVIDLVDVTHPQLVFTYDTAGSAQAVAADAGRVYLADGEGGLLLFQHVAPRVYLPLVTEQ